MQHTATVSAMVCPGPPQIGCGNWLRFASFDGPELCGRTSEVTTPRGSLDPAARGVPTMTAVTGLAGVGKTTLAYYAG
jgi:hypothetical protein